jgi:deazaflavin-dependent oxidoreductase (nitroreductase family)
LDPKDKLPRPGSTLHNLIHENLRQQRKTLKKFKFINNYFFNPLYRIGLLPLLGFSRIFLLLVTTGRKSGKRCIAPLEYHRINGVIHIFSGRGKKADWFKNLCKNPDNVFVKLGFHSFKPKIEIIHDSKEKLEVIRWYVKTHPTSARYLFGWNNKTDDPKSGILEPLADLIPIIKLHEIK